ncbi:MAG: hypothetical protein V4507_04915 [Verrucomicrobiota bacterium]
MKRIWMLILVVSLFLEVLRAQVIPPIKLTGYDPLPAFQKTRITAGRFAGAYTVAEDDARLNWYFANLGLLGFVDVIPTQVKTYMNLYLANLNANFSINDVYFNIVSGRVDFNSFYYPVEYTNPDTKEKQYSDSDDSYAATFLSLCARYYAVTGDKAWFNSVIPGKGITVLEALKKIANNNLIASQWPNGLTHVFQSASVYPIAYTEDNAEAYRGLTDFAVLVNNLGDPTLGASYTKIANKIAYGIQTYMYVNNLKSGSTLLNMSGFYNTWENKGNFNSVGDPLESPLTFYPDGVTQIFTEAYRVGIPSVFYNSGWNVLNKYFPNYTTYAYDEDPWLLIGLAAAYHGNSSLAQAMQAKTLNGYAAGKVIPINNWGFYRRISIYLQTGKAY